MRRGQIFTLDLFAAMVIFTVIMGFVAWQIEEVNSRSQDLEYQKLNMIANDWAEIALRSGVVSKQNYYDDSKWTDFSVIVRDAFAGTPYKMNYNAGSDTATINGGCTGTEKNVARVQRLIYVPAEPPSEAEIREFVVKVCV